MGKLNDLGQENLDKLTRWCINRQTTGFSGRVNKPWDTCYSFWIGATLKVKLPLVLIYIRIRQIIIRFFKDVGRASIHQLHREHKLRIRDMESDYWWLLQMA